MENNDIIANLFATAYPPIPESAMPAIIAAAEALERAGQHSIDNPDCALKDNPHVKVSDRLHKAATGRKSIIWECRSGHVLPALNADGTCKCHGREIHLYDTRRRAPHAM